MEIFSSGFSQTGEEGRRLEQEVALLAKGKLRVIGPNCFGVYCPRGGLTLLPGPKYLRESGNIAVISQSGGIATHFGWAASGQGLRFSKIISYGNACDINETDLLEYLASDSETGVIAAYIEGVKEGKRFFELARSLLGKKTLIIKNVQVAMQLSTPSRYAGSSLRATPTVPSTPGVPLYRIDLASLLIWLAGGTSAASCVIDVEVNKMVFCLESRFSAHLGLRD